MTLYQTLHFYSLDLPSSISTSTMVFWVVRSESVLCCRWHASGKGKRTLLVCGEEPTSVLHKRLCFTFGISTTSPVAEDGKTGRLNC